MKKKLKKLPDSMEAAYLLGPIYNRETKVNRPMKLEASCSAYLEMLNILSYTISKNFE